LVIEPSDDRLQQRLAKRAQRFGGAAERLEPRTIVGTPPQVIARLQEFVAIGVSHFIAMFGRVDRLESTELFAREVMPAFR
jgi:alkanesulfonate monooxygenase SsuD/methylene tetrahydromethanopterin reductase-like flavin-dependent oxidoreductase (luciferase family)